MPKPYTVIAIDKNHVTVQNDVDGGILRWHRDDLKKCSYTFTNKNNIPDHNSSVEDIEHYQNLNFENYENFARQIYDEYNNFDDKSLFQGNGSNSPEIETPVDVIMRSINNLLLDPPPNVRCSQRIQKPNPWYHDQDISTNFDI